MTPTDELRKAARATGTTMAHTLGALRVAGRTYGQVAARTIVAIKKSSEEHSNCRQEWRS